MASRQRKPRKPMTERQLSYIHILAAERGLRWDGVGDPEMTSSAAASDLITELRNTFSLTMGTFTRHHITTGEFVVIDRAKAESF